MRSLATRTGFVGKLRDDDTEVNARGGDAPVIRTRTLSYGLATRSTEGGTSVVNAT
jgi:hypothetical protein